MQENSQVQTTPPLPGPTLVDQVNKALQTIATNFSGDSDPAALAWPYATWADTANGVLKRRNGSNTGWVIERQLFRRSIPVFADDEIPTENIGPIYVLGTGVMEWDDGEGEYLAPRQFVPINAAQWLSQPLGVPIPLWDHLDGVSPPPTNDPRFRYIKLTAADDYNDGVLVNESVSGSAPLVQATAVIDFEASPLHGQTVRLINTERRVLRAGDSGVVQNDAIQNITGSVSAVTDNRGIFGAASGAFDRSPPNQGAVAPNPGGTPIPNALTFDASRVARTDTETRSKNIGADYYMRIY